MKKFSVALIAFAGLFVATQAQAQKPVTEIIEDVAGNQCVRALMSCKDDGVGAAWREARGACAALRTCKTDCRQGKQAGKKDNRADKKACVASCGSKRGKAKRQCKKACRQDKRSANKVERKSARQCKKVCRAEYKTPECKSARKKVAGALLNCAKKAGGPCVAEVQKLGK